MSNRNKPHIYHAPDYLIPVIKYMKRFGRKEAFEKVSIQLDVEPQTVRHFCTRKIGLSTSDFVRLVTNNSIMEYLSEFAEFTPEELSRIKQSI